MEKFILDSISILNEDNIQIIYDWMDIGDLICEKQRSDKILNRQEKCLITNLTNIVKSVTLEENITLHRGTTQKFDNVVAEKQFNSFSPNINTSLTYGEYIINVIVPKGSNAFYISAWEKINTDVEEQEEKEVLLLPGKFTLIEGTTYLYSQL